MPVPCRHFMIGLLGLSSGAFALGQIQVEKAAVGDRVLILTVDDSIQAPDLSKLQIDGYTVENAVFVEDLNPEPTRFSPNYLDLTLPGNGKVIDYVPTPGTMVVDLPSTFTPQPGTILADTAFGGLLRKVVSVEGQPSTGLTGRRWVLRTQEADLPEAVTDCDLTFRTRLDLNQSLADFSQDQEVVGELPDGSPAYGELGLSLKGSQVLFQPMVTGRIRIRDGKVEVFRFLVSGDCEVMANVTGAVTGSGSYEYEEELPGNHPTVVPLGSGLFLKVQSRPFFRVEANSKGDGFSAQGSFRIQNSIKGELGFSDAQWRPLAENKMTYSEKSAREILGEGEIKISVKPRIEMFLGGVQGPAFTFEPYARFTSAPDAALSPPPANAAVSPGTVPNSANPGPNPAGSAPGLFIPPVGGSPNINGNPGMFGMGSAPYVPVVPASGNRQLSLGSNIYMETRTNFIGPAAMRSFLLFNREQMVLSPPREGTLALKEADSSRISVLCQAFPKADYYIIQQKLGAGAWETLLDRAVQPLKIRIASLKPNSQYRFRAIGVNAMGNGPAFPPEGVAFTTPSANHPPFMPLQHFPDSSSSVADSVVTLTWRGGDPDPGSKVLYTVIVDTRSPPLAVQSASATDTSLELLGLTPGHTYYWKVIASDGIERTESPVHSFTIKAAPEPEAEPSKEPGLGPLVLVPKGTYRRLDGKLVLVGPFFLGKTEVTQKDYEKLTGKNPSYRYYDSLPVERVTWDEAQAFCQETGGRLPTEAEWEYAARAGTTANYYWGNESENAGDYAWYRDNSENHTQKVGLKKPNAWGLHDMAGNVFEWVQDWYGDYSPTDLDHPRGPSAGTAKVIRGASWYSEASNLSLSSRYSNRPGFRNFKVGFRCAKDVESAVFGAAGADPAPALASKAGESSPSQAPKPALPTAVP